MTTVLDIAKQPNVLEIQVSEYDHLRQSRDISADYSTMNTQQTFDISGRPYDARNDED